MYDSLERVFPVQNGEVRAVQAPAADSVQVVDEIKAAEQPASTTNNEQQGADGSDGDKREEPEKDPSSPMDTSPPEDTSNGQTVTVEI